MKTTTIARIHAKAVLPALLVANMAEGSVADKPAPAVVVGQFSDQEAFRPAAVAETETRQTRAYTEAATEWTKAMARRFRELAKTEALGSIAPEEMQELERLTHDRRNLEYPRPAEEVLWEVRQRRVTGNLVQALKAYVEFHRLPHRARSSAA
ncbi:MAG: hypothetical protein HYY24_24265 [Verrucomicrobia bacterium]|nr:hypothetical protein [Verrucomicrobiota bacterium]